MDIDPTIAAALGFPKPMYTNVERERRWLCHDVPRELIRETWTITDLYVTGARLRLREMRPAGGGPGRLRLTRKADVDARTRLITSIYLPEDEFALLAASLTGVRLTKIRHRLVLPPGVSLLSVDEFQGDLSGLVLAETEFETPEALAAFTTLDFATREVTDDLRYSDGSLAKSGIPR
ncbi:MAG: hypothetical protein ABL986_13260 [Vicinamibacterales bacterium]